jgi:hypothetical protein
MQLRMAAGSASRVKTTTAVVGTERLRWSTIEISNLPRNRMSVRMICGAIPGNRRIASSGEKAVEIRVVPGVPSRIQRTDATEAGSSSKRATRNTEGRAMDVMIGGSHRACASEPLDPPNPVLPR